MASTSFLRSTRIGTALPSAAQFTAQNRRSGRHRWNRRWTNFPNPNFYQGLTQALKRGNATNGCSPDLNPDPHRFKITCSRERLRKSRRLRECLKKSRICKKSDLMPSSIQSVADGSKHCRVVNSLQHANGSAGGSVSVLYSMLTIDRNHRTCTLNAMTRSLSSGSSSKT